MDPLEKVTYYVHVYAGMARRAFLDGHHSDINEYLVKIRELLNAQMGTSTPFEREKMIKEIQRLRSKYQKIAKQSEYVNIQDILLDLYHLEQDCRLKLIPKIKR